MSTVAYGCNWQENTVQCYEATLICPVCHVEKLCRMFEHWIFCVRGRARYFKMYYYFIIFDFLFCSFEMLPQHESPVVLKCTFLLQYSNVRRLFSFALYASQGYTVV